MRSAEEQLSDQVAALTRKLEAMTQDRDFWRGGYQQLQDEATAARSSKAPTVWDGWIRFDTDCVVNGVPYKAGTSVGPFASSATLPPTPAVELTVRQAVIDWNRANGMPLSIDDYREGDLADAVLRALYVLRRADGGGA